jgi:hypothetical protein
VQCDGPLSFLVNVDEMDHGNQQASDPVHPVDGMA